MKMQAFNFRMILTQDPANLVPFPKPENYDPRQVPTVLQVTFADFSNSMADLRG